jgi:hypothetical protein
VNAPKQHDKTRLPQSAAGLFPPPLSQLDTVEVLKDERLVARRSFTIGVTNATSSWLYETNTLTVIAQHSPAANAPP